MSQMIEPFVGGPSPGTASLHPVMFDEIPQGAAPGAVLAPAANPLHAIKVQLQVRVGQVTMTVAQLLAARENEVLALDRGLEDPVDLLLEGRVVARGELVAVDGHFGVRITELPIPLKA